MAGDGSALVVVECEAELVDEAEVPNTAEEQASGVTGNAPNGSGSTDRRRTREDRKGSETDRAGGSCRGAGKPS